jgi:hypothetical protein
MAGLITGIKRKIKGIIKISEPKHCSTCRRTLQQAIDEQLKEQKGCTVEHCTFKTKIEQAILESKTPEVILWLVDKTQILESENITLSWEVKYAKKITISGLGEVDSKENRTISPRQNTTYTLTIQDHKNNIYETENPINITVIPLPVIEIREENLKIERGNSAILRWYASNISKIILLSENQINDVTNLTEFTVQPNEHTTYRLIFTALDNQTTIEKEINVEVFPKPKIIYFKVTPDVALNSMPITLSWKVENAKKIEINNGVGEVAAEGEKVDLYKENTLYTMTAFGELSNDTEIAVIKVFPTPIIESLLVPMPDFESKISLNPIMINSPKIDVSINMPEFNLNPPQITEPDIDLQKIKPKYKNKSLIFNFSKIYERIKKRAKI